jgi:N12 class adenine-specific DNA methylase
MNAPFGRRIATPGLATLQNTERQMRPAAPAQPQQPEQQQGVPVLTAFEDIARTTGVPVNVLIADERIGTAETAEQAVEIGRQAAEELRPHFAEGRGLTDALRAATGDDRRARQWADAALARGRELYPDRFPENTVAEDTARSLGSAALEGAGYAADFAADMGDEVGWAAGGNVILQLLRAEPVQNTLRAVGDFFRGEGNRVRQGMDTEALQALADTTPSGNLFDPSTWEWGENPSPQGYLYLTANVLGSLAPVLLAGYAGGGAAAAAAGGAQGGGSATEQAQELVWQAYEEGRLGEVSAYYNSLLRAGFSEDVAAARTAEASGRIAGLMAAPIAGAGGFATQRIIGGAVTPYLPTQNLPARVAGAAVVGALEEGSQEAMEGVAARFGTNIGADGRVVENALEETFGDFLMGAIAGGPVSAAGGVRPPSVPRGADDDLLQTPLALPPPTEAQPASPPSSPMGAQGARPIGETQPSPPPTTSPGGPISAAAAQAPDRGVGGLEAGMPVRVFTPETGTTWDAEFIGENADGVIVRVGDQYITYDDAMLAQGITITDATGRMPVPEATQMPEPQTQVPQEPLPDPAAPTDTEQEIEALIAARWQERGNQITEDIAQDLRQIADEARAQGVRATLDSFVNRRLAELEQQRDTAMTDVAAGAIEEGDVTRNDGQPFPSQEVALRAMQNRGLDMRDYQMMQVDGGVVLRPLRPLQQPLPSPNDPNAYPPMPQPDEDAPGFGWPQDEDRAPAPEPDAGMVEPETTTEQDLDAEFDAILDEEAGPAPVDEAAQEAEPEPLKPNSERAQGEGAIGDLPIADFEAGNPGPQLRAWLNAATDQQILDLPPSGLADNGIRAEKRRRRIGEFAEPGAEPDTSGPTPEGASPPQQAGGEGRETGGRQEGQAPAGENATSNREVIERYQALWRERESLGDNDPEAWRDLSNQLREAGDAVVARLGDPRRLDGIKETLEAEWEAETGRRAGEPDPEPAAPPAPELVADTPADRWNRLDEAGREAALKRTSFVGKNGKLLKPAQNSLDRDFDKLGKAVKGEISEILTRDKDYRAILQDAQPETEMAEGLPNFNDPDAYPRPEAEEEAPVERAKRKKRFDTEGLGANIPPREMDLARGFMRSVSRDIDEDSDPDVSITEYFPMPAFAAMEANGVSKRVLGALAHIRASIRPNPGRGSYQFRSYVWDLKDARENAAKLLEGEITPEQAMGGAREPSLWLDFAESLENIDDIKRVMRFTFQATYKGYGDDRRIEAYYMSSRSDSDWRMRAVTSAENGRDAFYEAVNRYIQQQKDAKAEGGSQRNPAELQANGVRRNGVTVGYAIWYKLSFGGWKIWRRFDDLSEARAYLNANRDDIIAEIDDKRDDAQTGAEWLKDPPPRNGVSHRKGDITPEQFAETFGISVKDIGFGKNESGQEEQDRLNDTWDALHDLAGALDLPLKALFLNKLKLAFGRRGTGGRNPAAAHYESGEHLINLTRKHGAGTLAHEWLHALDLGTRPEVGEEGNAEREARRDLARALMKANAPWFKRAKELDEYRSKDYWSTREELAARGFEKLVYDRLKMRKMGNGFLVGINQAGGAYPSTREMRRQGVTEAYDAWLDIVRERFADKGDKKVTLPKPDPSLLDDTIPTVGQSWNGPDGIKSKIAKIEGQRVTVLTSKDGKSFDKEMSLSEVEDLIDRMAEYNDPEKIAEREAREAKEAEAQEKARIAEEERRAARERLVAEDEDKFADLDAQAEQLVAQFITDTKRKPEAIEEKLGQYSTRFRIGNFRNVTTAAKILEVLRDRNGTVVDGRLRWGNMGRLFTDNLNLKVHGDFAAWVLAKGIEIAPAQKTQAELDAEFDAILDDEAAPLDAPAESEQNDDADAWGSRLASGFTLLAPGEAIGGPPNLPVTEWTVMSPGQFSVGTGASPQAAVEAYFNWRDSQEGEGGANRAPKAAPRTAGESGKSAAKNTGEALKEAAAGLNALFGAGKSNRLSSGFTFDEETWEAAKPHFKKAVRALGDATKDTSDLLRAIIRALLPYLERDAVANMRPYVTRYVQEVASGKIDPWADEADTAATEDTENAGDDTDAGSTGPENLENVEGTVSDTSGGGAGGDTTQAGGGEGATGGGGDGAPDADDPGADAGGSLGDGGVGLSQGSADLHLTGENPGNFTITEDYALGEGTPKERIENNLAALRLLRRLQSEGRYATKEEQATLARYVGWGGLSRAFDVKEAESTNVWGKAYRELKELLTPAEYLEAHKSTRNAHYTSRTVVDAMWRAMRHMGVKGGRGLEPTVGTGNFLGLTPEGMPIEWYGAELDPMTGMIAKHLYPDATIFAGRGFQDAPFNFGAYDFAIGNPPFGKNPVTDKSPLSADLSGFKVHNYVMAKTARHLRPGGIMGMVVTSRFMDGASNAEGRDAMVKDGMKLLGGMRLPNTAFKENAGTEVVTDVLFFQKGRPGEASDTSWTQTAEVQTDQGPATINAYFAQNPDNVLGKNAKTGTMYEAAEYTVEDDGRDLGGAMNNAFRRSLPQGAFGDPVEHLVDALMADNRTDLPVNGFALLDSGAIMLNQQIGDGLDSAPIEITPDTALTKEAGAWLRMRDATRAVMEESTPEARREFREAAQAFMVWNKEDEIYTKRPKTKVNAEKAVYEILDRVEAASLTDGNINKRGINDQVKLIEDRADSQLLGQQGYDRLKAILTLRNKTNELLNMERTTKGDETKEMQKAREGIARSYRAFVKKWGYLGDPENQKVLQGDTGMEQGLEANYKKKEGVKSRGTFVPSSAEEGAILHQRVARPIEKIEKADSPEDALLISLQERGRVDLPWMSKATGMSTRAIAKDLMEREDPLLFEDPETQEYVFVEEYLSGNVKAKLEAALAAQSSDYERNIKALREVQPAPLPADRIVPNISAPWIPDSVIVEFLEDLGGRGVDVYRSTEAGVVQVSVDNFDPTPLGTRFRHPHKMVTFKRLAEAAIRGKSIRVTEKDAMGKPRTLVPESEAATELANQMATLFREQWAFQSPRRRDNLVDVYNEKMNTRRERVWDGERYLKPKGANEAKIAGMRRTQKNGAWRMIQSPSSLMHHVVGAGKTWTAVMAVMERKRLGLVQRPMVAVPNHLTEQWANEWREVYPGANLLIVGGKDTGKDELRRSLARMATSDVDAIIISHSALEKIPGDPAVEMGVLQEQLDSMQEALDEARKSGASQRTVKQISDRLEKYKDKLDARRQALSRESVGGITFESLGIDYLVVDEAHMFKNLEYFSMGETLVGMNPQKGSDRAFDLFLKTRSIHQRYPRGGISFLTGTPVSNSLVEIYAMLKYLAWDEMKAEGMSAYDSFAGNYVESDRRYEITASQQVKARNVLAGLKNLQALSTLYRQYADIILRPDLERIYADSVREWNAAHPDEPARSEDFPTPKIKGGKRRLLTAPATETQQQVVDWLVARMELITASRKDPLFPVDRKEYMSVDNDLAVLGDARKGGLDPRSIDPSLERDPTSKVARAAKEIKRIYDAWAEDKGTQLVFSDLSTPVAAASQKGKGLLKEYANKLLGAKEGKTWLKQMDDADESYVRRWALLNERAVDMLDDEALTDAQRRKVNDWQEGIDPEMDQMMLVMDTGFSVYDDLKSVLVEEYGIPESEVAFIHDAKDDEQKDELFGRVKRGEVRVLLGSTPKMGAGTNVQNLLVALHHLDAPWRPSDVEQREGRIIRAGNDLYARDPEGFEVELLAYSTEGTSDVVMWQVLERKAAAIEQFLSGSIDEMSDAGSDSDSFAEFMSQSTGDPVFRNRLAQDAITTRLRSEIEGREIAKQTATRELEWESNEIRRRRAESVAAEVALDAFQPLAQYIEAYPERKSEFDETVKKQKELLNTRAAEIKADKKLSDAEKKKRIEAAEQTNMERVKEAQPWGTEFEKLAAIEQDVQEAHSRAHSRWVERAEEARAERDRLKREGVPEEKWPDVPAAPARQGVLSQPVREKSLLAAEIYDVLGEIDPTSTTEKTVMVTYGEFGTLYFVARPRRKLDGTSIGSVLLRAEFQPKGQANTIVLAEQETKKPQAAPEISRGVWPSAIISAIENRLSRNQEVIAKAEERIPQLQQMVDQPVDREALERAESASTYFSILQRMAERQATLDRLSRGRNPFIEKDPKPRPFDYISESTSTQFLDGPDDKYSLTYGSNELFFYDLTHGIQSQSGDGGIVQHFKAKDPHGREGILTLEGKDVESLQATRFIPTPEPPIQERQRRRMTPETRAQANRAEIRDRLRAQIGRVGLSGKATVEVVSRLMGATSDGKKVALDARQRGRLIQVALDADDPTGALNHEIIHMLRDPELWGAPYGLFTKAEWQSLVRASRSERRTMARVKAQYPDLSARQQTEEVIAEMYREWSRTRAERMRPVASLLRRMRDFLSAVGAAVTGSGYKTAHEVMIAIEGGVIGARAQARDADGKFVADESGALKGLPERQKRRDDPEGDAIGRRAIDEAMFFAQGVGGFAKASGSNIANLRTKQGRSDKITDLMVGSQGGRFSLLALVPGRQLLTDLARQIPAARRYDRLKQAMDTLRNEWQARMDDTAREWGRLASRDREANNEMMAIMHDATVRGVDPSENSAPSRLTKWEQKQLDEKGITGVSANLRARAVAQHEAKSAYGDLRRRYAALPRAFRDLYRKVQGEYQAQQDAFEQALIDNIKKSQLAAEKNARRRYEQEMQKIRDDGLKGDEKKKAEEEARKKRDQATGAMQATMRTRIAELRLQFESAKLKGPYFPLSRFGDYFVTLRDEEGKIISFSLFETAAEQRAFAESDEAKAAATVEADVLDNEKTLQEQIAPTFMADIQKLLGDMDVDKAKKDEVMDEVWQRYLRSLPDASLRSRQIHRKGTPGFSHDAYRAFADHMFHGAHQLARLEYGVELTDALKDMRQQVPAARDRNRARAIVNEIEHRHAFTMNPTGAGWSQSLTQLSFVWYLGATPAAAMVNLSQTTVVGPAILAARYQKSGFTGAANELGKALKHYGRSKMDFSKPETLKKLSDDEKEAMKAAYEMGVVDKTQAHDLAQIAESGIQYNAAQQTAMRYISAFFHGAEVTNRNITYLAAYRMARKEGMDHAAAVDSAADATWAIHFDYQNTSRPRFMQGDVAKVLFIFRNFSVNMLYRLVRDTHQALNGADAETRKQARIQLAGITASMALHAGITGTWGYGLITLLLGAFFPGGDDDVDRHLERILMGDDDATALRRNIAGVALYGLPGHRLGWALSERIGMPNLWFREPYRDLDARGQVQHYMNELLGPGIGLVADMAIGLHGMAFEPGNFMRDVERVVPKFVRDGMRAARYANEGVTTWRGDALIEDVDFGQVFTQAMGFTPAAVAERYRQNSRMLNRQGRIQRERQDLTRAVVDAALRRERVSARTLEEVMDFNRRFPEYAITRETINRSLSARQSRAARGEFGITLNTSLNRRIRTEESPLLYGTD